MKEQISICFLTFSHSHTHLDQLIFRSSLIRTMGLFDPRRSNEGGGGLLHPTRTHTLTHIWAATFLRPLYWLWYVLQLFLQQKKSSRYGHQFKSNPRLTLQFILWENDVKSVGTNTLASISGFLKLGPHIYGKAKANTHTHARTSSLHHSLAHTHRLIQTSGLTKAFVSFTSCGFFLPPSPVLCDCWAKRPTYK